MILSMLIVIILTARQGSKQLEFGRPHEKTQAANVLRGHCGGGSRRHFPMFVVEIHVNQKWYMKSVAQGVCVP